MKFILTLNSEAYPARDAGMHVCLVFRPGNAPLSDLAHNDFVVIQTLDDMNL